MLNLFKKDYLKRISNKNFIKRFAIYIFCTFLLALTYNVFFVRYNLVVGGVSGLAIVIKDLFGIGTSIFNIIATVFLLLISFILIGKKETKHSLLGAIVFPTMITITEPISSFIHIEISSYLFMVLFVSTIYGILSGIIYKLGFNAGGTDIVVNIIKHYKKMSVGEAGNCINIGIVILSCISFGITRVIYCVISLFLMNFLADFVLLGNRDSKICIIKTKRHKSVEKILRREYLAGYTILKSAGGLDKRKRTTLFCIMPTQYYYDFCQKLKDIDASVFMYSCNCYSVSGGYRKRLINI